MRILLLAQFLPPVSGGEEQHVWRLASALAGRSHDVTLLGFTTADGGPPEQITADGVRVVRIRTAAAMLPMLYSDPDRPHALPLPDPLVSREIGRQLAAKRFDVVHAHNWIVNSALGPTARAHVPLVMTLHDYSHVCVTKRLMDHGEKHCAGPALARCLSCASAHYGPLKGATAVTANAWSAPRRAKYVTKAAAVSSAVAEGVAVRAGGWLSSARLDVRVIPNFIPDELIVEQIQPPKPDAPLVFVGDLSADKGVQPLLDAYARLDNPPALVLAGRPLTDWNYPPGTSWAGLLPHDTVVELLGSARIVVVPSIWSDPCPTVVLEAMAAGRPVVATSSGGIVDMVVDGQTGLLCPPGDAAALARSLDALLSDPDKSAAFGKAGRDRARRFTVSATVQRVEQMYADAIAAYECR